MTNKELKAEGERIKQARLNLNMTQEEMAVAIGVNPRTYPGYEKPRHPIPKTVHKAIAYLTMAKAMGMEIERIAKM